MNFEEKLEEQITDTEAHRASFTNTMGDKGSKRGLEPGQIIAEHYEIIERIGQGGMSIVYKARHILMNRIVAVKVLTPSRAVDAVAVRRFQQEAEAASRLKHSSIVRVDQFGFDDASELPFLVMEYIDGPSVSDWIEKNGPMSQQMTTELGIQVAEAISVAHAQGVVHRDLKPSNILLKSEGEKLHAIVVDFGIAKIAENEDGRPNVTKTGEIFGSPDYMSPEQCLGNPVDKRSDIYSLGCVLYEMLSGTPPFRTASPLQTIMLQIGKHDIDFKNMSLTPGMKSIIRKCMEKDPAMRFDNMLDVKEALKQDKRIEASAKMRLQKLVQRVKREPKLRIVSLLGLMAACSVVYFMGEYYRVWPHDPEVPKDQLQNAEKWQCVGRELRLICQYKKAIKHFEQAIKLDPNYYDAYFQMAYSYYKMGDFAKAAEVQKTAYELRPKNPYATGNLGLYLFELGDYKGAKEYFEKSDEQIYKSYPDLKSKALEEASLLKSKDQNNRDGLGALLLSNLEKEIKLAERTGDVENLVTLCDRILVLTNNNQAWQDYRKAQLKLRQSESAIKEKPEPTVP